MQALAVADRREGRRLKLRSTVEPDLSEFSYGFALTSELIARFHLKGAGAPVFATTSAEAKAGGGWDVKLTGMPLYLQFKRSDRMKRRTAREAGKFSVLPFYRMHLRRRDVSKQHQLMLDLEAEGKQIFYAAPCFADSNELSKCYTRDTVAASSIFIRPSAIGPLKDDKKHYVAFQLNGKAYFCSEPREIETVDIKALIGEAVSSQAELQSAELESRTFGQEADDLLRIYEDRVAKPQRRIADQVRRLRDRRSPAEFLGQVARTLFETEFLIVSKLST